MVAIFKFESEYGVREVKIKVKERTLFELLINKNKMKNRIKYLNLKN